MRRPWGCPGWSVIVVDDRDDRPTYQLDGPYRDLVLAMLAGAELVDP